MNELTLTEPPSGALEPAAAAEIAAILPGIDPWRTLGYRAETLSVALSAPVPGRVVLAVEGRGQRRGSCWSRNAGFGRPYVELFAVFPEHLGGGDRQRALLALVERYRGRECNLWLSVPDLNTWGQRFYRRCGFVEVARLEGLVRDGLAEILMRKRLPTMD